MKKCLSLVFSILALVALLVCMVVILICHRSWQKGYTLKEWLNNSILELEKTNKLPNYDEMEIRFINRWYEDDYYCFTYEVVFIEVKNRDNANDIDLFYTKEYTYTFSFAFEYSSCFWNRLTYFTSTEKGILNNAKFEKCFDLDVSIKEDKNQ